MRELDGAIERARPGPVAVADSQHRRNARLVGAREDVGAIGIETLVFEMAVGVGEHKLVASDQWLAARK